jgi:hypothetical protein
MNYCSTGTDSRYKEYIPQATRDVTMPSICNKACNKMQQDCIVLKRVFFITGRIITVDSSIYTFIIYTLKVPVLIVPRSSHSLCNLLGYCYLAFSGC